MARTGPYRVGLPTSHDLARLGAPPGSDRQFDDSPCDPRHRHRSRRGPRDRRPLGGALLGIEIGQDLLQHAVEQGGRVAFPRFDVLAQPEVKPCLHAKASPAPQAPERTCSLPAATCYHRGTPACRTGHRMEEVLRSCARRTRRLDRARESSLPPDSHTSSYGSFVPSRGGISTTAGVYAPISPLDGAGTPRDALWPHPFRATPDGFAETAARSASRRATRRSTEAPTPPWMQSSAGTATRPRRPRSSPTTSTPIAPTACSTAGRPTCIGRPKARTSCTWRRSGSASMTASARSPPKRLLICSRRCHVRRCRSSRPFPKIDVVEA